MEAPIKERTYSLDGIEINENTKFNINDKFISIGIQ
jgi:hypothetical protein